jgi:hypothetical protein
MATVLEQPEEEPRPEEPLRRLAAASNRDSSGNETGSLPAARPVPALHPRAILLALPLIVLDAFWVILAERVGYGPYFTSISLFANVLFLLTALLVVNAALSRVAPRLAFSQAELLLIYSMLAVRAALAGIDMLQVLVQMMGHPYRFGNAANGWLERFGPYLPLPLMVSDKDVLAGYYQGHASLYAWRNIAAWAGPVLLWTGFTVVLFWTMRCLSVIVRKAWPVLARLHPLRRHRDPQRTALALPLHSWHLRQARQCSGDGHLRHKTLERHRFYHLFVLPVRHRPGLSAAPGPALLVLILLPVLESAAHHLSPDGLGCNPRLPVRAQAGLRRLYRHPGLPSL